MSRSEGHPAAPPLAGRLVASLPRPTADGLRVFALQAAIIGTVLVLWEAAVASGLAQEFVYGRPSAMFAYLATGLADGTLLYHTGVTLAEQAVGLLIGTVVGTVIGLAFWWSPFWSKVFEPYAVILNATPKIVVAPLLVVWFGLGMTSKVMIAVITSFVVAWLGAYDGARRTDADQADLVRVMGGSEAAVFRAVVVPSALPDIVAALRLNVGLSLIAVITGEFLSSTAGLGYLVDSTAKNYQMSHTLGAILILAAIAAIELWAIERIARRLLRWA